MVVTTFVGVVESEPAAQPDGSTVYSIDCEGRECPVLEVQAPAYVPVPKIGDRVFASGNLGVFYGKMRVVLTSLRTLDGEPAPFEGRESAPAQPAGPRGGGLERTVRPSQGPRNIPAPSRSSPGLERAPAEPRRGTVRAGSRPSIPPPGSRTAAPKEPAEEPAPERRAVLPASKVQPVKPLAKEPVLVPATGHDAEVFKVDL